MLRHRTGSGKLFDSSEAHDSLVDKHSELHKGASVWHSEIRKSLIVDSSVVHSRVHNSFIHSSFISNTAIVDCPLIAAELLAGGFIYRSEVRGKSRISGGLIEDCHIKSLTMLGGHLIGFEWDAREGYVSRGTWLRPPRQLLFDGLTITESVIDQNGLNLFCGCFEYSASHWLKCGDRYGAVLGLSPEEVDRIRQTIYEWQRG